MVLLEFEGKLFLDGIGSTEMPCPEKGAREDKSRVNKNVARGNCMAKVCVICGEAAGSREHVFPAVLGGRRVNKGIYCTPHNNGFGRHVAELAKQLEMFNAILMVRSDHRDKPKAFVFEDEPGSAFSMIGSNIQTAAPSSISELGLQPGEKKGLKFESMEQFEQWREAQRKDGWEPVIVDSVEVQRHHFASPVNVSLTFGGKEGLQAVAYLALTFFAQYFPVEARQHGLDPLKEFLKLDLSKDEYSPELIPNLVWWDGRAAEDVVGKNPFSFGHAVVVGVSRATNRAYAYISFFSSLNFGIDLGPVEEAREGMAKVFIDPKAEKAPEDIEAQLSDKFSIEIDSTTSDLGHMIRSGSAEAAVGHFLGKVGAWHFELFIDEIRHEVTSWAASGSTDSGDFSESLVEKHSQRVLNLLISATSGLKTQFASDNLPAPLLVVLDAVVVADEGQPNGLSQQTNTVLALAKAQVVNAVGVELSEREPSPERIANLLGGGLGVALVTATVVQPILLSLLK